MPTEAAALYNEIEPHAAAWLRNLIALGELPDGVVDERSIVDVRGDDLAGCDELHFFAGIGVWARAVAEAERSSNQRLARPLFTGSCPCQPLSSAGQRKGHVDERHLWPAFHRLIAERRPATILGEQVAGKDGREWMAAVRHDLEASGYAVGTAILPAGGFGAPHIRYRMFFVAHAEELRRIRRGHAGELSGAGAAQPELGAEIGAFGPERGGAVGGLADARSQGLAQREYMGGIPSQAHGADEGQTLERDGAVGGLADAGSRRFRGRDEHRDDASAAGADEGEARQRQWLRPDGGANGGIVWPHTADSFWSDADWIFCRDGKWRPIEPGSFPLVDGSAFDLGSGGPYEGMSRAGMLRGYGNAVVLPVARAFVECAMEASYAD